MESRNPVTLVWWGSVQLGSPSLALGQWRSEWIPWEWSTTFGHFAIATTAALSSVALSQPWRPAFSGLFLWPLRVAVAFCRELPSFATPRAARSALGPSGPCLLS